MSNLLTIPYWGKLRRESGLEPKEFIRQKLHLYAQKPKLFHDVITPKKVDAKKKLSKWKYLVVAGKKRFKVLGKAEAERLLKDMGYDFGQVAIDTMSKGKERNIDGELIYIKKILD